MGINQFLGVRPAVLGIVVGLAGDGLPLEQRLHVLQQQVVVEDLRLVIVEHAAFRKGQLGMIPIIGVLVNHIAPLPKPGAQCLRQGGLSAAAGPAYTDEQHTPSPPCLSSKKIQQRRGKVKREYARDWAILPFFAENRATSRMCYGFFARNVLSYAHALCRGTRRRQT